MVVAATFVAGVSTAFAGFAATDTFLPMVGRQVGVFPSNWYTDVWIHNPGTEAATARIYLLERNTANPSPPFVDVLIAPGDTEKLENVVESLFHKQVFGALRVACETQKLVITSRVYSKGTGAGGKDSMGQDFAGVPAAFAIGVGEKTQVLGVYQTEPAADSEYRFNFGFVETTGHTANVRVRAFDGNGADQGYKDFTVREFSQRQVGFKDHFPTVSTENVRLEVEVLSGTGKVIAYGSAIGNGSQDPTTFEMEYADTLLGIATVQHDGTLAGDGTAGAPLGLANAAVTLAKLATTNAPSPAPMAGASAMLAITPKVLTTTDGSTLSWQAAAAGDITAVNTTAASGLIGGETVGDVDLAIAPGGVTGAMLAPSVTGSFLNTSSTPQTKAGKLTLASTVDLGIEASGPTAGGSFQGGTFGVMGSGTFSGGLFEDLDGSGKAYLGYGDLGIEAQGNQAGGSFHDRNNSGQAQVAVGDVGIDASGSYAAGYFHAPSGNTAMLAYDGNGIDATGSVAGGYFRNAGSGRAYVAHGSWGIEAYGLYGGKFESSDGATAWAAVKNMGDDVGVLAVGDVGVRGNGSVAGGQFQGPGSGAVVGAVNIGIDAEGSFVGGYFHSSSGGQTWVAGIDGINASGVKGGLFSSSASGAYTEVASGVYKAYSVGTNAFVQNHPVEKDRVIVYASPEGDEVATYTRGTGRLANGEARISLGATFQWVTNPDLGLTAHLTPVGDWSDLYVAQKSTTELVVRSHGGSPEAAFDYIVYGLRIGFEEASIVQEKRRESYIPSFKDHRERYAKYPELRAYNALERFKGMESARRGVVAASLDMSRAAALKEAVHEYDPATDPPVDELLGFGPGPSSDEASQALGSSPPQLHPARATSLPAVGHAGEGAAQIAAEPGRGPAFEPRPGLPTFPVSGAVETGDVLVMDPGHAGSVARCAIASDRRVVGIAAAAATAPATTSRHEGTEPLALVAVAMSNVVACKVDATAGPIEVGDLLVASATPGHAMRATAPQPGTVIGKALEPLASGTGAITVLVMMR